MIYRDQRTSIFYFILFFKYIYFIDNAQYDIQGIKEQVVFILFVYVSIWLQL